MSVHAKSELIKLTCTNGETEGGKWERKSFFAKPALPECSPGMNWDNGHIISAFVGGGQDKNVDEDGK